MNQTKRRKKTITLCALVSFAVLYVSGCGCQEKLEFVEQENTALLMRVSELEAQLMEADARAAAQAPVNTPAATVDQALYLVVQGDTLWGIAKNQLGQGNRYKEILALNPQLTKDTPLKIGTQLKMPAR